MKNCDGCYYEERPPQEACNLCSRGEDGHMTGWVSREKMETAMGDATTNVATIPQSAAPTAPLCMAERKPAWSHWDAKYTNDNGEYEITFASTDRATTKMVERACQLIIDEEDNRTRAGTVVLWDLAHKEKPEWATPLPSPAVTPSPQGEGFDADEDASLEENLLLQIEEQQEELEQLREADHLKQLLIEEQRKQIDAWREEIDAIRAEREDLRIMLDKAKAEAGYYKEALNNETRLRELAYAKLDMVHLIFGGDRNG